MRALAVVPAHGEAASLPGVVADVRECCPGLPVLVVDDGSRDGTWRVADALDTRWLRLEERLGVGSAVKAGVRYAVHHGFAAVVRLDGDGQHAARDAARLVERLATGDVDAVLGTRYSDGRRPEGALGRRLAQRVLAGLLSLMTGECVTDPTCGCAAFGPRALALLAEHHPPGYPEPELRLLLRKSGLRVVEMPIEARPRTGGRSTLTTARLWLAAARVLLAMIVVPLRDVGPVWDARAQPSTAGLAENGQAEPAAHAADVERPTPPQPHDPGSPEPEAWGRLAKVARD